MITELDCGRMSLAVDSQGAELASLKLDGRELLWQGSDRFWNGRAPVLFPIVCGLRDNFYTYKGKRYDMPPHGFASASEFTLAEKTGCSLSYRLKDSGETRKIYPFPFALTVTYSLQDSCFTQTYRVENPGEEALPFSIGVHTALNCPLGGDESFEDYFIQFEKPVTVERQLKENGLLAGKSVPFLQKEDTLPLSYSLFKEAIPLLDIPAKSLELANGKGTFRARYDYPDYRDLGIWTMPGAPFLCIEPWNGYDSYVDSPRDLLEKPGILVLEKGKARVFQNSISFILQE